MKPALIPLFNKAISHKQDCVTVANPCGCESAVGKRLRETKVCFKANFNFLKLYVGDNSIVCVNVFKHTSQDTTSFWLSYSV